MKILNLIKIMKIFDLIKSMKIFDLINRMNIFNLIKVFETNSNFGFHALENPLSARSVRGPFPRSFTIGRGSRHSVIDPNVHDRNEKVTRAKKLDSKFHEKVDEFREINTKFRFLALDNPSSACSVRGPFAVSFKIGTGYGHWIRDVTCDDRSTQVTVRNERSF
jgi:hypothetical protein